MPCSTQTPIGVFNRDQKWLQVQQVFQFFPKGLWLIHPHGGGKDVFVYVSIVERAGMSSEGQKVSYDVVSERGKLAARKSASRLALGCD